MSRESAKIISPDPAKSMILKIRNAVLASQGIKSFDDSLKMEEC